jgi:hypothetical protein
MVGPLMANEDVSKELTEISARVLVTERVLEINTETLKEVKNAVVMSAKTNQSLAHFVDNLQSHIRVTDERFKYINDKADTLKLTVEKNHLTIVRWSGVLAGLALAAALLTTALKLMPLRDAAVNQYGDGQIVAHHRQKPEPQ